MKVACLERESDWMRSFYLADHAKKMKKKKENRRRIRRRERRTMCACVCARRHALFCTQKNVFIHFVFAHVYLKLLNYMEQEMLCCGNFKHKILLARFERTFI